MNLPPKKRLNDLLLKALSSNNMQEMDDLYHMVADTSNALRRKYGLPVTIHALRPSVLKTPRQQLADMGVDMFRQAGMAVYAKCQKPRQARQQVATESLFSTCFVSTIHAQRFRDRAIDVARTKLQVDKPFVVLPPLCARSTENGSLRFRIDIDNLQRAESANHADLLLVFFAEGVIIPIVRQTTLPNLMTHMRRWYGLEGHVNAQDFWQEFGVPRQT